MHTCACELIEHPSMKEDRMDASQPLTAGKSEKPARYIMIGGFLGAGKTTSVAQLANWLSQRGSRVGLITNDQGSRLVDTQLLGSRRFPVEEIAGGCFCCRFNSLVEAAKRLTVQSTPDVFVAEPVGSCTDLVATVTYPLRKLYGSNFLISPLSVLVDPIRAMRVLGLDQSQSFSEKVLYIYRKQLEEADVLVINKCDLLNPANLAALRNKLETEFPKARIFEVSARNGTGTEPWFEHITSREQVARAIVEVDYQTYAEGEAELGWLNCTIQLKSGNAFDANHFLSNLASDMQLRLNQVGAEIAHLKMTLDSNNDLGDLAVINLVRNDFVPELSQQLKDKFKSGELTINMRAEAAPETLRDIVTAAMERCASAYPTLSWQVQHIEFFRPGKPTPTHRVTETPNT